jgi:hypothetical protein
VKLAYAPSALVVYGAFNKMTAGVGNRARRA